MAQVEIPDSMADEIKARISLCPELGFESVDEFVREAVRKNFCDYGLMDMNSGE